MLLFAYNLHILPIHFRSPLNYLYNVNTMQIVDMQCHVRTKCLSLFSKNGRTVSLTCRCGTDSMEGRLHWSGSSVKQIPSSSTPYSAKLFTHNHTQWGRMFSILTAPLKIVRFDMDICLSFPSNSPNFVNNPIIILSRGSLSSPI